MQEPAPRASLFLKTPQALQIRCITKRKRKFQAAFTLVACHLQLPKKGLLPKDRSKSERFPGHEREKDPGFTEISVT